MSNAITIRVGRHGLYQDVLDAAEFYAAKHGGAVNALAYMVRESDMYRVWEEAGSPGEHPTAQTANDGGVTPITVHPEPA